MVLKLISKESTYKVEYGKMLILKLISKKSTYKVEYGKL